MMQSERMYILISQANKINMDVLECIDCIFVTNRNIHIPVKHEFKDKALQ